MHFLTREQPKTKASPLPTETSPQSTAATEASSEPIVVTESGSAEWTRLEELALLGMKAEDMTWKEIDEMLPGKDVENIKKKYGELFVAGPASVEPKEGEARIEGAKKEEEKQDGKEEVKTDKAKTVEESKKEKPEDKKSRTESKRGRKKHKEYKAEKGKGRAEYEKSEEGKPEETRGILKAKATAMEKGKGGELKSINGHPVIFVDDDEELNFNEVSPRSLSSMGAVKTYCYRSFFTSMPSTHVMMR